MAAMKITIRQRADAFNDMGPPKSEAGERSIPMPVLLVNALKEWKLACPKGDHGLAFPNGAGKPESRANIANRGLKPTVLAAGVTVMGKDAKGEPKALPKYTGLHALRHFYASWCINPVAQGGMGLSPKVVQERLGHASIAMTLDVYGHLFPSSDGSDEVTAAAAALLS